MARGLQLLSAVLFALLLNLAIGQPSFAQPVGVPSYENPRFDVDPRLPFCSPDDKDKAVAAVEAAIAKEEAYIKDVANFRATHPTPEYLQAGGDRDLERAKSDLARDQKRLARIKAREVVDCRTLKNVMPVLPRLESTPFQPRGGFCDPKAAADYIAALKAAIAAQERDLDLLNNYEYDLEALLNAAANLDPRFKNYRKEIDEALKESSRILAEAYSDYNDLKKELVRAERDEPIKCPPRAAPQPGPGGGPVTPPAPGPKPGEPRPKPPPTFPRPGPDTPPSTPQPPGAGPKAPPAPAPGGPGAFHLPWTPQRPIYQDVEVPGIPAFCDEPARNAYLTDVLTPAIEAANHNVELSDHYLTWLNEQFALGNKEGWPTGDLIAIKGEIAAVNETVKRQQDFAAVLQARFQAALKQPLSPDCPKPRAAPQPPSPAAPEAPKTPEAPKAPPPPNGKVGCNCPDQDPIAVGPNNRVGSGARTRQKALSTAAGLVGGLLGGGGGGGGGGSDGPQLVSCRINDKEMTVFDDPTTGTSLQVGAKRSGDKVVVFANVAKSPDSGSFQTAYLQDGDGARQAPANVGICDLWGEWSLSVSWTRTTYVNDQVVSRESGGFSKSGAFHIPGTVSTAAAPDGLWRRLGFSNASHGARKIALTYDAPKAKLAAGPLGVVIHIARPGQDPVTTAPFALKMSEGPKGFVFERAGPCGCTAVKGGSFSDVSGLDSETPAIDYRTGAEDATKRKVPGLPKTATSTPTPTPSKADSPSKTSPDAPKTAETPPPPGRPTTVEKTPEGPQETDAELDARRRRDDAAHDERFSASAPKRDAYHARLDEIAKGGPGAGGSDYVKDSIDLDNDGVPTDATVNYFRKDFPFPIYTTVVDGEGHVTGGGYTPGYRAYMTMKAAVRGGLVEGSMSYGNGPDGPYVEKATVKDQDGNVRGEFTFGPDGNVKTGETFDPEGHRVGVINGP